LIITDKRKKIFAKSILAQAERPIGFADVGSGGSLKAPWCHLPAEHVRKFDFEPTAETGSGLPLCVSDQCGVANFYVAHDERASSFHEANPDFVQRFGQESILPKKTIQVECTSLDEYFKDVYGEIDALDINVEGHDFRVLQGGQRLLEQGWIKLIKVEFELAPVWHGQGWFSDVDAFLRERGYELVDIEIGYGRPVNVGNFYNKGEPLWGKGYYAPSPNWVLDRMSRHDDKSLAAHVAVAAALFVAAGLPGRAYDMLDAAGSRLGGLDAKRVKDQIAHVFNWARLEHGLSLLGQLVPGVIRALGKGVL
jgi:FkbM family methyltransferase